MTHQTMKTKDDATCPLCGANSCYHYFEKKWVCDECGHKFKHKENGLKEWLK